MTTNNTTITENFLKTYTDKTYQHTTMIRHNGVVVALAMDRSRRIYYSVLNLDDGEQDSPLDVNYWLENPQELGFPNEIAQVGYAIAGATMMPIVKKGSRQEAESGTLRTEEIDPFLSSTARLSADAPFQALSDEQHIYIFRQSIAETDGDMVFKTESGGASGDSDRDDYVFDIDGNKVPIVKDTLLVDRFILAGTELKPTMEVRYQRSRHKTHPQSNKDTLGSKDMNGNPFFEPTQELAFVCHLQQGRFSVLLLPTQISEVQRWQVFSHNSRTRLIDSFNIERGADGLFNTKGTQLYTSPDPEYQQSVLERQPGKCPFTDEDLIPIVSQSDYAESALAFDGQDDYINCSTILPESYTKEAWIRKLSGTESGYHNIVSGRSDSQHAFGMPDGKLSAGHNGDWRNTVQESQASTDGVWIHVAVTYDLDNQTIVLYKNGIEVDRATDIAPASGNNKIQIGGHNSANYFEGQIDEVRIWDRARTADEIKADMNHRLIGNELGLVGYWRFDEGSGNTAHDQTENANHGTIHGNPTWVNSDAPVGDHPGMRRTSFKFQGRRIESGIASLLAFDGQDDYVAINNLFYNTAQTIVEITIQAWVKTTKATEGIVASFDRNEYWRLAVGSESPYQQSGKVSWCTTDGAINTDDMKGQTQVNDGQWHLITVTYESGTGTKRIYVDGNLDAEKTAHQGGSLGTGTTRYGFIGVGSEAVTFNGDRGPDYYFQGQIDEVRIWNRARTADEINADMNHRLIGNELGLVGYWRFDEGSGNTAHDHTENANHGTIHGNPTWANSDAPVGDNPGLEDDPISLTIESGIASLLYYQQEQSQAGYDQQEKPMKTSARVMLAVATGGAAPQNYISVLDFGLSREGKLAQVPDNIDLGTALSKGSNEDLERLAQLQQEILDLEDGLNNNLFYFQELEKIQASDKQADDKFGVSVAISGDYAIVGAYHEDTGAINAGAAYIFERNSNGQWQQTTKLQASDKQTGDDFGSSVAISGDYAIVGAYAEDTGASNAGAAYIFERNSNGQWQQTTKLQASDKQGYDQFGKSVAISGDYAIVGAYSEDTGATDAGAAYIFERNSNGQWQQTTKLQASDKQAQDHFGKSVAISGDYAIVGAYYEDTGASNAGAAYIFERNSTVQWQQKAKLQASDKQANDYFGHSVAISGDYAIVGAYQEDTGGSSAGAAYIFERNLNGHWQEITKLQASDKRADDWFGKSVAISGDCAIVGAYYKNNYTGAAYVFGDLTAAKEQELAEKQLEAQALADSLSDNVTLPMHLLHTDPCGLTVSGALLGFAYTNDTPQLFDSVLGQLSLYFRGTAGEFFSAYYDTNTAKAQYTLAAETGTLNFIAVSAEPEMDTSTIAVSDGTNTDLCTVIIENTAARLQETWTQVPRNVLEFASVLNGVASQQIFIGALATDVSGTTTSLTLESKVKQALKNGDRLLVGETKVTVSATVERDATEIPIASASLAVTANTAVHRLQYDYETLATADPTTSNLQKGSLLFLVNLGTAQGKVQNGTATSNGISQSCAWFADSPGKAYAFDGQDDYIAADDAKLAQLDASDDLALEVWVNANEPIGNSINRLIHHHSADSQYGLAIKRGGTNDSYSVIAAVGNQFIESEKELPCESWQHLTAVFNQSYGLQFNGGYLKCGTQTALNIGQDLTLEIFLKLATVSEKQGLIGKGKLKDGTDQDVPYALFIDSDRKLVFAFEDKNHGYHQYKSTTALSNNSFHKIALTRKRGQTTLENKETQEITIDGQTVAVDAVTSVEMEEWDDITFYIDGNQAGNYRFEGEAGSSEQELEIGRLSVSGDPIYFNGTIGEIRVWNTALEPDGLYSEMKGAESGLLAWWRFEENQGNIAYDTIASNHGNIVGGAQWVKNPDPNGSQFLLYLNGQSVKTTTPSSLAWGDPQFTLAGYKNGSNFQDRFSGTLEEIRIWKVPRTQEQIQDNLFTRLKGEKQDLIAYYSFDLEDETQLTDHSLLGNHLLVGTGDSQPSSILSTAPISNDIALVRSALAGVSTQFHDTIDSRPAVQEYGDTQYDSEGNLIGVMKRCYTYIKNGQWHLFTGYKVGNLITEWVSQAQFNPQVMGYLEGTPPVPSENLTYGTYEGDGSAVSFIQADEVMYNYSTSKENGFNSSFGMSGSMGVDFDMRVLTAPLGFGISQKMQSTIGIESSANFESSGAWSEEQGMSTGRNVTKELSASLAGNWEDPSNLYNPALGRRWVSNNSGFALVLSDTADVFAMRLVHNNALVAYQYKPNPDIPKDWNIIPFPLNPRYTMQGTLDGKIGYNEDGSVCTDPNYPQAATYGEYSYFKPQEAYAIKQRIDQEMQELQNYYSNFDASPLSASNPMNSLMQSNSSLLASVAGAIPGASQGLAAASTFGSLDDALSKDQSLDRKFAKRNLANTYVWTADGGFYAETTDTIDVMQDSVTGSYSFSSQTSSGMSLEFNAFGADFGFGLDSSMGGSLNITKTKSKEASKSFSIDVSIAPSGDMQYYDPESGDPIYEAGQPKLVTGRVDAYRFMTFYLDSSTENFEDLFSKVVDPIWLEQSSHPNAVAMRQANQAEKKPGCWRLMHRVTFVSRILPDFIDSTEESLESAMKAENIDSNYELIKQLEPFVKNKTGSYAEFSEAVRNTLATYMPELLPHADEIIQYAALYFGVSEEI